MNILKSRFLIRFLFVSSGLSIYLYIISSITLAVPIYGMFVILIASSIQNKRYFLFLYIIPLILLMMTIVSHDFANAIFGYFFIHTLLLITSTIVLIACTDVIFNKLSLDLRLKRFSLFLLLSVVLLSFVNFSDYVSARITPGIFVANWSTLHEKEIEEIFANLRNNYKDLYLGVSHEDIDKISPFVKEECNLKYISYFKVRSCYENGLFDIKSKFFFDREDYVKEKLSETNDPNLVSNLCNKLPHDHFTGGQYECYIHNAKVVEHCLAISSEDVSNINLCIRSLALRNRDATICEYTQNESEIIENYSKKMCLKWADPMR